MLINNITFNVKRFLNQKYNRGVDETLPCDVVYKHINNPVYFYYGNKIKTRIDLNY
jgi:hypothetical protein